MIYQNLFDVLVVIVILNGQIVRPEIPWL